MMIFDYKNPKHIEILREEISRAKKLIKENQDANMYMRGIFSIIFRDNDFKNTNSMQDFIAGVVNATSTDKDDILNALKDYARANPEKMQDLNIEISKMAEPLRPTKFSATSSLTPDAYKDGQGRGGWQGD